MRTVVVSEAGGPEVLRVEERPTPVPGGGEVLVRLLAANVNPTDLKAREGQYPPDKGIEGPPFVLGWDLAGEVVAVGDDVDEHAVGERVVGMIPWYEARGKYGAYAEEVLVREKWLVPLPEGLEPALAATVPLNALTAAQALDRLDAPDGAQLLILGASGAVGSFAVQLARERGLRVVAVAGREDEEWVESLGAEKTLPRDAELDSIGSFDYVLDAVPVGSAVFPAVADGGRILATRAVEEEAGRGIEQIAMLVESDPERLRELLEKAAAGELRTRVAETIPLPEAAEAHRRSEESGHHGKSVLVA
jgi:NADPH:quinone reductase-like Zn-dependent oxidoreductase